MAGATREDRPLLSSYHYLSAQDHGGFIGADTEFGGTEARAELERSLLRKLDRRMSILILIYILNYIDRNNASAARLRGFERDLHLEGTQFASILSILYVGYTIMQIPSNMLLNQIGKPSLYLPYCMMVWGLISISTGFTTNFLGALTTRFFLGFVEAAFFPGALFLISKWYKRTELSQRTALLSCGSLISNAFGSLIASGILDFMEGRLGYAAWRWLFFIEGTLTVLVAISAIYILPDFPETSVSCRWLTPAEQALAHQRMLEEAGVDISSINSSDEFLGPYKPPKRTLNTDGLTLALRDGKVWWLALALTSMVVSLSFNAYFPTLCATMGYGRTATLLLCAPPWMFATGVALVVSRHSDQTQERYWHVVGPLLVGIGGFMLAISTMNTAARYISLFLMAQSYAGFICFLAWASGSVALPVSKRAVALAFINTVSSLGHVPGSYLWPTAWGPTYRTSYAVCIACSALSIGMCTLFRAHLRELNRKEGGGKRERYLL